MKPDSEFHRKEGAKCFNEAWELLDKKGRTKFDDMKMLELVHSSMYHWSVGGESGNRAISAWQVSRAYSAMGESRLALTYAAEALRICEERNLPGLLPSALEGVARAEAVAGRHSVASSYLSKAMGALRSPALSAEDRRIYLAQIRETRRIIDRGSGRRKEDSR